MMLLVPILMKRSAMTSSTLITAAADRGVVWTTGALLAIIPATDDRNDAEDMVVIGSSFSAGGMKASEEVASRGEIFIRIAFRTDSWLRGITTRPSLILFNSL